MTRGGIAVNEEDTFQRALDEHPSDWQTRLVFADWLQERDDPRADGYRAIARRRRYPLDSGKAWWWACRQGECHNIIPEDWFDLLPPGPGSALFWPLLGAASGNKSRRECEDALALAFTLLPADRRAELLKPLA